jgi:transcriptional regulator with XRE-family HTH domain
MAFYLQGKQEIMTVGERIFKYRNMRGLSQLELAQRAKIPQPTLSALESGTRNGEKLALDAAKRLAKALDVTLDMLAGYRRGKNGHGTSIEKTRRSKTTKTAA